MNNHLFPYAGNPAVLELEFRLSLQSSLQYIYQTASLQYGLKPGGADCALEELGLHRISPGIYGRYFEIVPAFKEGKRNQVCRLLSEIIDTAKIVPEFSIIPFDAEHLAKEINRYARLIDIGSRQPSLVAEPSKSGWDKFSQAVPRAIEMIGETTPKLRDELEAMLVEIIGGAPHKESSFRFGSASSMMLWGAAFFNVERHSTTLDVAEGLVHETTHHLLFALSHDEPLVGNPIEQSCASPLRESSRPIDGVYHATFVCARIYFAYRNMLDANILTTDERFSVEMRLKDNKRCFFAGLETITRFANLTANGKEILDVAISYMNH